MNKKMIVEELVQIKLNVKMMVAAGIPILMALTYHGPYTHASSHTMWESKQPAWGGRPRPHHLSIHGHTYV